MWYHRQPYALYYMSEKTASRRNTGAAEAERWYHRTRTAGQGVSSRVQGGSERLRERMHGKHAILDTLSCVPLVRSVHIMLLLR
jgi:hypothetical protein